MTNNYEVYGTLTIPVRLDLQSNSRDEALIKALETLSAYNMESGKDMFIQTSGGSVHSVKLVDGMDIEWEHVEEAEDKKEATKRSA